MYLKVAFAFLLIIGTSSYSYCQKIKYKDLILLLDARQFEKAEPFLKRYLKDNSDNPSAYLFMGITYQEKALSNDVLTHTEILIANCDSAVLFFDKAYNTITEKELKRNDENYQMYSRRDLRTGDFGIKLSDVRLDLETRVKSTKERKERVKELNKFFVESKTLYFKANSVFKEIESKYETENSLYLQSDEALVASLNKLAQTFDSTMSAFTNYKSVLKQIGKTNYNQQLNLQEIIHLKKHGTGIADFTIDDLKIWDYKRWAKSAIETIEKVIDPLRDRMISYDIALNKIRDRIKKDSVSVVSELIQLEDRLLYSQLQKFDPDPLPIAIFEMKKAEMKYQSDVISHKPTRDSSNIMLKLSYLTNELADIHILDSITSKLVKRDLDKEGGNYHHFISKAYGTKAVLSSLIKTTQDFMNREKLRKEIEWEATIQATKWAINGSDSIPLFFEQTRDLNFKPLVIVDEKFTIGLTYKDSLASGYFYSITPTRIPDVKATFTVEQSSFTKRNLPLIKCISLVEPSGQVFFSVIFSESKTEDKFPVTITKIYKSDGLAWSNNYRLDLLPTELTYAADSGELSIKTSAGGDSKIIVLDKNGKQVQ